MTGELVMADVAFLTRRENFGEKVLGCASLLIRCRSILRPSISQLRVTSHVLWQDLHASYPSQASISVDLNLTTACEVLRVVDEHLMNPVNIHVDDPSLLINGHFD
jgi:hypothetical protein